jgi:hypothetical protein
MPTRSLKRVLAFSLAAFLTIVFVFFAPGIFGPMYTHAKERELLQSSLSGCAPNEVRLAVYFGRTGSEMATFNFETKLLDGNESNPLDSWSASGAQTGGGYNVSFAFKSKPFTDDQIAKVKSLLASLPPAIDQGPSIPGSYRDQFHLAFYLGNELRIYHYAKDENRQQLEELCAALQVRPHFDGR